MKRMKIYIAGPYNPKGEDTHGAIRKARMNVEDAIEAFVEIKKRGHIPFVPHLTHFIHINPKADEYGEWWYEYDLTFLKDWADAIYMLDDWEESKGSRMERKKAYEHSLDVFYDIEDIPDIN